MCNDDQAVLTAAQVSAAANAAIFGVVHLFIAAGTPQLGAHEDLFITAHGLQGEIGNHGGALGYNAQELLNYLTNAVPNARGGSVFPGNYAGDIYISACYSANVQRSVGFSFVETFHNLSRVRLAHTNVFGQFSSVPMGIPTPGNGWTQVANL